MCTKASHDALKLTRSLWNALQLVGYQSFDADEYGPAQRIELRNCGCGSTLALDLLVDGQHDAST
jgi:hypothetical protein